MSNLIPSQYNGLVRISKKDYKKIHQAQIDVPIILATDRVHPESILALKIL